VEGLYWIKPSILSYPRMLIGNWDSVVIQWYQAFPELQVVRDCVAMFLRTNVMSEGIQNILKLLDSGFHRNDDAT
jgi:hypothetical protein